MANEKYIIIPGTQQRVYDGSVVILYRLPNLRWIIHYGYYNYNGRNQKGWYFSSIPADTVMPVFNEDLVAMYVIDSPVEPTPPGPCPPGPCPPGPFPPGPGPCPPGPPVPIPIPFTPQDKAQLSAAMLTVQDMAERNKLNSANLKNGKVVRVNDTDGEGTIDYFSWDSESSSWLPASLGYRYMTKQEILEAIGDDIVQIVWSNENGALVLTNHAGEPIDPIQLLGVAHDPIYVEEDLQLRIPVYGRDDFIMTIPKDNYIRSVRFEMEYEFTDPDTGRHWTAPAIVITVSDGIADKEIAGDASAMVNIYKGVESPTTRVIVESDSNNIQADVKLSSIVDNPVKVDNEGLWVDLSGTVGKKYIDTGFLLVADGQGEFTYGGTGIEIDTSTSIEDLTNKEKYVVTANLIADAISAAFSALKISLEQRIADIETRVSRLEDTIDVGEDGHGEIIVVSGDTLNRSTYKVGGAELDTESSDTVATEEAITKAFGWRNF